MGGTPQSRRTGRAILPLAAWCAAAVLGLGAVLCMLLSGRAAGPLAAEGKDRAVRVRKAAVAGAFYPGEPAELRRTISGFLMRAQPRVPARFRDRRPRALIVPHAGYPYSGQTAAYAYKLLADHPRPSRVVLLGPSHYVRLSGTVSVPPFTHYRTPLGEIPVDVEARDALLKSPRCVSESVAHLREHSLEVQLPFIQVLWEDPPKILPIVVGDLREEALGELAGALREIADEETLFLASSDFTHYGPRFAFTPFRGVRGGELAARIRELDSGAIEHVENCDAKGLLDYCDRTGATICGRVPIAVLLEVLAGCRHVESVPLHYANSGDTAGDYTNSVSYHAHAFWEQPAAPEE